MKKKKKKKVGSGRGWPSKAERDYPPRGEVEAKSTQDEGGGGGREGKVSEAVQNKKIRCGSKRLKVRGRRGGAVSLGRQKD